MGPGKSRFRGRSKELTQGHVKFEIPTKYQSEMTTMHLEHFPEVQRLELETCS